MITLAFYCGEGRFEDRLIRSITRSRYSHVELMAQPPRSLSDEVRLGWAWSASYRDGGVRQKEITFAEGRWEFVSLPWASGWAPRRIWVESGCGYDLLGLIGSQLFNLRLHRRHRWFCSELCAHALNLAAPHEYSPGALYHRVTEMNRLYEFGLNTANQQ
jgi:hypothetical protein